MGQFKPMVKMETTEPSVILKLKKGGHVAVNKDANGHTNMKSDAFKAKYSDDRAEDGAATKKPSMADRRKAMSGALLNSKKGGKVEKKAMGGAMGAPMAAPAMDPRKAAMMKRMMARRAPMAAPAAPMAAPAAPGGLPAMKKGGKAMKHEDAAQDRAMIKKAMAGKKFAAGGTIEGNAGKYVNTKVVDGDKHDSAQGTGGVKMGKPAGYKTGGTIEGNAGKFANTKVVDGDKTNTAKGTGDVKMGKPAGYKKGGAIGWENRPANTGDHFDSAKGTGEVRNGNAGGYKKGGAAKKHFATGGSVEDTGRAVAMPKRPVSKPVSNTNQSGTFKKGGKVEKFDGGSAGNDALQDLSNGEYDKFYANERQQNERDRDAILGAPGRAYDAVKRLLGGKPGAGAGRGFVNPPMAKKRGGSAKC
jgi:hypothetical protein